MKRSKDVLTTGEVARICKVAPRTVSKWFDSGQLRGYRIPGSKDRRIPVNQLVRFMRAHGIPLNGLETGLTRVLILDDQSDMADLLMRALTESASYDVRTAGNAFEAGAVAGEFDPHVMIISGDLPGLNPRDLVRTIRSMPDLSHTRLVAVTAINQTGHEQVLRGAGFDAILHKPLDVSRAVGAIEDALAKAAS
jgi:excisionase family DNA binding protein